MKRFIKEYLKVISYAALGLIFIVASFYLVMNYYHYEELKRPLYISSGDINYLNYQEKLNEISNNLNEFRSKNSTNDNLKTMYNKLLTCQTVLQSDGTLANLPVNTYFNSHDIYELGSKFQTDVLNVCWALHLSYLTEEEVALEFQDVAPYVTSSINTIHNQVNFALAEIQNNSSYFYTTNITSSTIRNYLSADYTMISNAYNEFADIILNLSETINKEIEPISGGNND